MQYYVVMPSGERFGPATLPQLNQWIQEGRVLQTTTLQNTSTNQVVLARDVQGLVWTPQPMADPYGQSPYGSSPYGSAAPGANPYQMPGASPMGQTPYPRMPQGYGQADPYYNALANQEGNRAATTAFILSLAGFLCCPICAPIALVFAYKAKRLGARNATAVVAFAWLVNVIFLIMVLSLGRSLF